MKSHSWYEVLYCPPHGRNWKNTEFKTWRGVVKHLSHPRRANDSGNYQIQRVTVEPVQFPTIGDPR